MDSDLLAQMREDISANETSIYSVFVIRNGMTARSLSMIVVSFLEQVISLWNVAFVTTNAAGWDPNATPTLRGTGIHPPGRLWWKSG